MNRPARTPLSMLDSTFLRIEAAETPMHVAALQIFALPEGAGPGYVAELVAGFRRPGPLVSPFDKVLTSGPWSLFAPAATVVTDIDLEYHVRHTALPAPGGERELGDLVSHLHSVKLDRSRPLWTCHVIEGLVGNRFAIYLKVHHALTDGVNAMRVVAGALSDSPDAAPSAPWQERPEAVVNGRRKKEAGTVRSASSTGTIVQVARGLTSLARRSGLEPVRLPFEAPASILNPHITTARRVATQQVEMSSIREIAKRTDASVNDVFLAICGDALHRYLAENDALPEKPLIAGVPVSLREDGQEGGNAVGFVWTSLGTNVADPLERLTAVQRSMAAAKSHLRSIATSVRPVFTMLTMLPPIAVLMSGQGARVRPSMNVVISNVPGPSEAKYLGGARLEAFYPVSIVFQGLALNITCISYDGKLNIGVTGGRDALPHLQRIAVYMGDAVRALDPTALV